MKSDIGTDEEVYQNKQKQEFTDDDIHEKQEEKEDLGDNKEREKQEEKEDLGDNKEREKQEEKELEAEEEKIESSLEVEREYEGENGYSAGEGIGLGQIAGNVLGFLTNANRRNLASVLTNKVGIKPGLIEDLGDLISGEESVSEIVEDLGKKVINKLIEYPLKQLKNAFEINSQRVLASIGTLGLDSNLINTFTSYLGDKIGFNKFIQTQDGQQILSALSEEKGNN